MSIILRFYVFSSLFCSQFTDPHTKTSMKKDQKPANVALGYRLIRLETFFIFSFIRQLFGLTDSAWLGDGSFFLPKFCKLISTKGEQKMIDLVFVFRMPNCLLDHIGIVAPFVVLMSDMFQEGKLLLYTNRVSWVDFLCLFDMWCNRLVFCVCFVVCLNWKVIKRCLPVWCGQIKVG